MKVKVQTPRGEIIEIEVNEDATIKDIKRQIYSTGKIIRAVRILGWPDETKLSELQIRDGDFLSILVEPEEKISIQTIHGFNVFGLNLSSSTTVKELKQLLVAKKQLRFPAEEFELFGDQQQKIDDDENLPLHHYGIQDGCKLTLRKNFLGVLIENQNGEELYLRISKSSKIGDLKQRLLNFTSLKCASDLSLFTRGIASKFRKIGERDEIPISEVLVERDRLYLIENKFCKRLTNVTQHLAFRGKIFGIELGDTVLSVKLRAQDQLDILAEEITIKGRPRENHALKREPELGSRAEATGHWFEDLPDCCVLEQGSEYQILYRAQDEKLRHFSPMETNPPTAEASVSGTLQSTKLSANKLTPFSADPKTQSTGGATDGLKFKSNLPLRGFEFSSASIGTPVFEAKGSRYVPGSHPNMTLSHTQSRRDDRQSAARLTQSQNGEHDK